jgi:hypothetical protein
MHVDAYREQLQLRNIGRHLGVHPLGWTEVAPFKWRPAGRVPLQNGLVRRINGAPHMMLLSEVEAALQGKRRGSPVFRIERPPGPARRI